MVTPLEQSDADAALLRMRQRFELLIDSIEEYAIFILDPAGNVATWNTGAQRLKGYDADEIVGRHFSAFYTDDDVQAGKPARQLLEAAEQGVVRDEGWRVRKDGTQFWGNVVITSMHDSSGKLQGFAKVTRDETQRQQAERSVRELELLVERERIAAAMHDSIVHRVFETGLTLQGALRLVSDPVLTAKLEEAIAQLDGTLRHIRTVILDLGDPPPTT